MFCSNCGFQLPAKVNHCPRCGAPVQGQQWTPTAPSPSPSRDRHGVWSSFGFVCVVFATAIYAVSAMESSAPEAPAQHKGSISVSRLVKEFRANEAAAEKQWRRRTITVDGTVDRIGVSFGDPYVMLSEGGSLNGVRCDMDKSRMDEAARLKKGQHIAVIGDVSNYIMGDVFLQRCRILDAEPASYSNTVRYLRLKKQDCVEVLATAQVEDGSAAEITCSRRGGGTARYLLVLRECRLGSRGDVKELKK